MKKFITLFTFLTALSFVLAACGTPKPLHTPTAVTSLPNPTTLTYDQYDSAVIGVVLEPGESRTIHTTNDEYFNIFFAGKNGENYVGYISKWNGNSWSDWSEVSVTADAKGSFESLSIEAETRPQEPCLLDACLNEVDWYFVNFDGVRNEE